MSTGKLIVLEGIDGSGITTQAKLLAESLPGVYMKEPTTGPIGQVIRQALTHEITLDPHTLALLFAADRREHSIDLQAPLDEGRHVICDRYLLSSLVYQRDCGSEWVQSMNAGSAEVDLTIFLDVRPEVAAQRRKARGSSQELFEQDDTLRRCYEEFNDYVRGLHKSHPSPYLLGRCFSVPGHGTVEQVHEEVVKKVQEFFVYEKAREQARRLALVEVRKALTGRAS